MTHDKEKDIDAPEAIEAYLRGADAAFREVDSWARTELRVRYRRLAAEHEDLAQTVHERLLAKLREGGVRQVGHLRGYVKGIVHHVAIDRLRVLYRERGLAPPAPPDVAPNPYDTLSAREDGHRLHQVLLALPERCRELWYQVFVERRSYEEIARRMKIPVGTVKSRMFHCRRRAAELFDRSSGSRHD